MFLSGKIKSSSITEVVIAMTIIAICFGVASIVFARSIMVTQNFQDFKLQTEIQGEVWKNLMTENRDFSSDEYLVNEVESLIPSPFIVVDFISNSNSLLWNQEILQKDEN